MITWPTHSKVQKYGVWLSLPPKASVFGAFDGLFFSLIERVFLFISMVSLRSLNGGRPMRPSPAYAGSSQYALPTQGYTCGVITPWSSSSSCTSFYPAAAQESNPSRFSIRVVIRSPNFQPYHRARSNGISRSLSEEMCTIQRSLACGSIVRGGHTQKRTSDLVFSLMLT